MAARKRNTRVTGTIPGPMTTLQWLGLRDGTSLRMLLMLSLVLVSGLSVVYLTHQNRYLFNELQNLRDEANELDVQWGQLLIEQSSLGLGGRVEQRAMDELEMQIPAIDNIVMVRDE